MCPVFLYFPQCRVKQETRILLVNLREMQRAVQDREAAFGREEPMPDQEHKSVVALDTLTAYNCAENQRD